MYIIYILLTILQYIVSTEMCGCEIFLNKSKKNIDYPNHKGDIELRFGYKKGHFPFTSNALKSSGM